MNDIAEKATTLLPEMRKTFGSPPLKREAAAVMRA